MATRSTVIIVGDLSVTGNRPLFELSGINPTYDDEQIGEARIWSQSSLQWQHIKPGFNTDPALTGLAGAWSFESRLKAGMTAAGLDPGLLYVLKWSSASTLSPIAGSPSWSPAASGGMFAAFVAAFQAAASAAVAQGDSLSVIGIVIGAFLLDAKHPLSYQAYGPRVLELATAIKSVVAQTPGCSLGLITGQTSSAPVVAIEPSFLTTNVSEEERFRLALARGSLRAYEVEALNGLRVLSAVGLTVSADESTLIASSMVRVGETIGWHLKGAVVPTYAGTRTPTPLVVILGDSVAEGTGTNAALQSTAAIAGATIFNFRAGVTQALQPGVNNAVSLPPSVGHHGVEISYAQNVVPTRGEHWFVKATVIGARSRQWHSSGVYSAALLRPLLLATIDAMRVAGREPRLLASIALMGANDILAAGDCDPKDIGSNCQAAMSAVRLLAAQAGCDVNRHKATYCLPATTMNADPGRITEARTSIQRIAKDPYFDRVVDMTGISTIGDNLHPSTTGYQQLTTRLVAEIYS